MKTIMLMLDTLRRDSLPMYGGKVDLPNFKRLEEQCITFDNFYASSLPCMPARREMHTGYPNFLHRGWGPLEPYDVSFVETLKRNGIYTHIITDHQHYWEDGGATYHNRYNSYEFVRGQEGDIYKAKVKLPTDIENSSKYINASFKEGDFTDRKHMIRQDEINRLYMVDEKDYPQTKCIDLGLEFLEQNHQDEDWFLQVECFDPHEPFYVPERFQDMIDTNLKNEFEDWPHYTSTRLIKDKDKVELWHKKYEALLLYVDYSLGRILDFLDENKMWEDTVFILNTDHGFMFGEKEWAGKCVMPIYEEVSHTPFMIHVPNIAAGRNDAICQTYDIAETMYELYDIKDTAPTFGRSILKTINSQDERNYGYSGYFGGHVNIFDKKYTYMRAAVSPTNTPLEEYTLMPMRMRNLFSKEELSDVELTEGYSYFKDFKVLKIDTETLFYNSFISGHELYQNTPKGQVKVKIDKEIERRFCAELIKFMNKLDSPQSQYKRLGLDKTKIIADEKQERKNQVALEKEFEGLCIGSNDFIMKQAIYNLIKSDEVEYVNELREIEGELTWEILIEIQEDKFPSNVNVINNICIPT